ncbi:radical SAM protein [Bdellovibrio reynosensis]|uniref:radical SAM protein n=1 Tax=Bdellovibrio reynosensis TaxID=2835041 RepID=UPI0038B2E065
MINIDTLFLEINSVCNIHCKYCFYEKGELSRSSSRISPTALKVFFESFGENLQIQSVSLSGGEILLHREIEDLLKTVRQFVPHVLIMTNGTLLSSTTIQMLEKYVDEVHVSLDSITSSYHEKQRGLHRKTLNGLELLRASRIPMKTIVMTVSNGNKDQIDEVRKYAKEYSFLFQMHPVDNFNSSTIRRPNTCKSLTKSIMINAKSQIYPCFHLQTDAYLLGDLNNFNFQDFLSRRKDIIAYLLPKLPCYRNRCWPLI